MATRGSYLQRRRRGRRGWGGWWRRNVKSGRARDGIDSNSLCAAPTSHAPNICEDPAVREFEFIQVRDGPVAAEAGLGRTDECAGRPRRAERRRAVPRRVPHAVDDGHGRAHGHHRARGRVRGCVGRPEVEVRGPVRHGELRDAVGRDAPTLVLRRREGHARARGERAVERVPHDDRALLPRELEELGRALPGRDGAVRCVLRRGRPRHDALAEVRRRVPPRGLHGVRARREGHALHARLAVQAAPLEERAPAEGQALREARAVPRHAPDDAPRRRHELRVRVNRVRARAARARARRRWRHGVRRRPRVRRDGGPRAARHGTRT
jgi:hypothetical protein